MATVMAIIAPWHYLNENFGWLSDAPCASVRLCVTGMRRPESIRQIFFIFCMKLTYDNTTKTHI